MLATGDANASHRCQLAVCVSFQLEFCTYRMHCTQRISYIFYAISLSSMRSHVYGKTIYQFVIVSGNCRVAVDISTSTCTGTRNVGWYFIFVDGKKSGDYSRINKKAPYNTSWYMYSKSMENVEKIRIKVSCENEYFSHVLPYLYLTYFCAQSATKMMIMKMM